MNQTKMFYDCKIYSDGKPITVDGVRFEQNAKSCDLSADELCVVQNKVYHHVKQAKSNRENIQRLKR